MLAFHNLHLKSFFVTQILAESEIACQCYHYSIFLSSYFNMLAFTHNVTELQIAYSNGEIITKLSQFVFWISDHENWLFAKIRKRTGIVISVEENNKGANQTV